MTIMKKAWCAFIKNERGTTAIEYAIIAAGLSVAIVGAVALIATEVETDFLQVQTALQ